ncbi:MAG: phosphodiester glycosidase family protein [Desulfovibrio sp.]|nr:phosphodiester glycosidase family protein [Desulfovibrio sp.]
MKSLRRVAPAVLSVALAFLILTGEIRASAAWVSLEAGLETAEFDLPPDAEGNATERTITVLRIDPEKCDFLLCSASLDGRGARTLDAWGEEYALSAAINASMYLPDGSTSTGYMREGRHVNNGRIVKRFGAFFVAGPDDASLPAAAILDRDAPGWEEKLAHYRLVIQNYRMIDAERRLLWAEGGPLYAISAVAQTGDGRILFLHCRRPVEAHRFARDLLELPLDVRTVMYVEGGAQAGMLIRSATLRRTITGAPDIPFLITGRLSAPLPNVLGVRAKSAPVEASTP